VTKERARAARLGAEMEQLRAKLDTDGGGGGGGGIGGGGIGKKSISHASRGNINKHKIKDDAAAAAAAAAVSPEVCASLDADAARARSRAAAERAAHAATRRQLTLLRRALNREIGELYSTRGGNRNDNGDDDDSGDGGDGDGDGGDARRFSLPLSVLGKAQARAEQVGSECSFDVLSCCCFSNIPAEPRVLVRDDAAW
jgi:hypothetical protein